MLQAGNHEATQRVPPNGRALHRDALQAGLQTGFRVWGFRVWFLGFGFLGFGVLGLGF